MKKKLRTRTMSIWSVEFEYFSRGQEGLSWSDTALAEEAEDAIEQCRAKLRAEDKRAADLRLTELRRLASADALLEEAGK